ncbi:MAG: thermostable hemolysin [Amylibacter sp.]|nr:thermostable hemolysin [Amylibacter sp.]
MKIEFLEIDDPRQEAAKDHIRKVYYDTYGAHVTTFAPLLVTVTNQDGQLVCVGGIRTATDGFFSDTYLDTGLSTAVCALDGTNTPASQIMEVVSVASTTPFPVLPMFDAILSWGREQGMTCGVFTITKPLRKLLKRTGLHFKELCFAVAARVDNPENWGTYYQTEPVVCVINEAMYVPDHLSPRNNGMNQKHADAV